MEEVWAPIKGYEGLYEVSNFGEVKSLERTITPRNAKKSYVIEEQLLKPGINSTGYKTVCLCRQGKCKTFKVHALVASSFLGPKPDKQIVRHGFKGKLNNSVENLSYGTFKDNEYDKIRDNTSNHVLPTEKILEMRKIYNENQLTIYQLSKLYELDPSRVRKIVLNISYKHVK
jgi:hypothetical protein